MPTRPAHRDASWVLALAAGLIVLRPPGSFYALALAPVVVIGINLATGNRVRWPARTGPLWWLLGTATLASALAALTHPGAPVESLIVALVMAAWAVAITSSPSPRHSAGQVITGLGLGLGATWVIGLGEVITGYKLLPVLYPEANTVDAVINHRLFVTATFPNYNDFSLSLVMLALVLGAWLLWSGGRHPIWRILAWTMLVSSLLEVAVMGSRGALIAAFVGFALLVVRSARRHQPWLLNPRIVVPVLILGGLVAIAVFTSPYVQDHSAQLRDGIARNIATMIAAEPLNGWLGWGSYADYQADAAQRFGQLLMDPHNLLLEIVIWYGAFTLVAYVIAWVGLVWRGFATSGTPDAASVGSWQGDAAWVVSVIFPLLGIVPSSTLRYYLVWLFLIAAWILVGHRDRRRAVATPSASAIDAIATTNATNSAITVRRPGVALDATAETGPSTTAN